MVTLTCKFTFPDGAQAAAKATAEAPEEDVAVTYTGAFERLPRRFDPCQLCVLRIWAGHVAAETGARLVISASGRYGSWAA